MAYLVFKNEEGLVREATTFIKAAKTESDLQTVHNGHTASVDVIEITDAEYDDFLNGNKKLTVTNEVPSLTDQIWPDPNDETMLLNKESFEALMEDYKEHLVKAINRKPNHSQIGKVTAALDFITNFDSSNISYPTTDIVQKLKIADKYVNLNCI